jgi:hypothetical protein
MRASPGPRLALLAPGLVAGLAIAFTLRPVDDFDVWYHLAAGRLVWATWSWPSTNTFAFTAPNHPWIDLHWVFQLLLYGAWAVGGPDGCIVLALALVLATVAILYAAARRFAPPSLVAALLAIALVIASPRLVPRPEMLSFVLLAAYLWLLDRHPSYGRALYLLVPLQILWTNAQGIFAVGLALIGCYWLGATLAFLPLPRGWREESGCTPREWWRLTIVLVLATAACLLNPYGIEGMRFPLQLLARVTGNSLFSMRIGEFRGPFESGYAPPLAYTWAGLLVAAGLSFLLNVRRWHIGRLLAVAAFGLLSTQTLRNTALFAWIAVPAIAANVGLLLERRAERVRTNAGRRRDRHGSPPAGRARLGRLVPRTAEGAVASALVLLIVLVTTNRFSWLLGIEHEFGLGVSRLHVPIEAVDFARDTGISGRPFNCLAMGGYLAWRLAPDERVFVDGRLEAYPETLFRTYFHVIDAPKIWPQVAAAYGFDYALLYDVWGNRFPLIRYLAAGHGWKLVYYDETASLFVPTDEAHRATRERAERAFAEILDRRRREPAAPPPGALTRALVVPVAEVRRQTAYGDFLEVIEQHAAAAEAYERALLLDPDVSQTRFSLGLAYWRGGEPERAVLEWRDVLRRDPGYARARRALAEVAQVAGPAATAP